MRQIIVFWGLLVILAIGTSAYAADAHDLVMTSGFISTSTATNFGVAGESFAGSSGSANYTTGIGLAVSVFSPVLPNPSSDTPTVSRLDNNALCYPNPFRPGTENVTIAYQITPDQEVKIYIIDLTGAVVKSFTANSANKGPDGYSRATWDGRTVFGELASNGVYLVKIVANNKSVCSTKLMAVQ